MSIVRNAENHIAQLIDSPDVNAPVILVEGARQVGKTTCIHNVLSRYNNVLSTNLETNKILKSKIDATNSFTEFVTLMKSDLGLKIDAQQILFIDEAQESERLGTYVRNLKEELPKTKTILTGSSMKRLFRAGTRIPVGRTMRVKINPFSFDEFLVSQKQTGLVDSLKDFSVKKGVSEFIHRELLAQVDHYFDIGGLPAVAIAAAEQQDYRLVRTNIFLDQEEDFVNKEMLKKRDCFRAVLSGVANNLGFPSKYSQMGVDDKSAKDVLAMLKAWHLVLEVEQKGINATSKFHPKRYLYDTGMANYLRNMPFPKLSILSTSDPVLRTSLGGVFENLALLALSESTMGLVDLSSWKKGAQDRAKVDFVWRDEIAIPIECKATLKVSERNFNSVKQYLELTKQPLGIIVTAAPFAIHKWQGKKLVNLPIYLATPEIIRSLAQDN